MHGLNGEHEANEDKQADNIGRQPHDNTSSFP